MKYKFIFFSLLTIFFFLSSCTRDKIPEIVDNCEEDIGYFSHAKEIIDATCAYVGCHLDVAPGNFTNYENMKGYLTSGAFYEEVIENKTMPPKWSTNGPDHLTEEQLRILRCWAKEEYPE